ncbi:UDP-N-acetylglucosamine 2-epimerase (hydrolyzing), partial [bacterium]|nr:UDP-N-acetylglucosamine 2-epimerase (hydrolyzing) [bacterium]
VVGGAALLDRYGNIEPLMKADGIPIDSKFHMIVEGETPTTMAKSTGLGLIDVSMIFDNLEPDVVVIVGDRFDVLAPTIAAAYMNIPPAHTMGGEVSGTIDESIRHAITKFAHIHFPANEDAKQRIIKMGEDPKMVFDVGCPRMDLVREKLEFYESSSLDQDEFFTKYKGVGGTFDLEKEPFLLVSQHPVTTEFGKNRAAIEETLYALQELKMHTVMLWPNADAGSDEISKGIRTFREKYNPEWLHLFTNLPFETYLRLMSMTACLIGNSSSGVREGAFIGTPVVGIGSRQQQRLKGLNLLEVLPQRELIVEAVMHQLKHGQYKREALYGEGATGVKIADIISKVHVSNVQKVIGY